MAIDRLRAAYASSIVVSNVTPGQAAYADGTGQSVTPYTFVGDGTAGTVNGATYRVHRFEYNSGTAQSITFSQAGSADILLAAGGGAGGGAYHPNNASSGYAGGGGGAGGLILLYNQAVTATTYSATVGDNGRGTYGSAGPTGAYGPPDGGDTIFGSWTAVGGGQGGIGYTSYAPGSGGSGGGCASGATTSTTPGTGTPGQGNDGGVDTPDVSAAAGGGGGGYLSVGLPGGPSSGTTLPYNGGNGGDGIELNFDGTLRGFAAGGGGGSYNSYGAGGSGGTGGGGTGGNNGSTPPAATGYGCGGGGSGNIASGNPIGGDASQGLILVRYRIG